MVSLSRQSLRSRRWTMVCKFALFSVSRLLRCVASTKAHASLSSKTRDLSQLSSLGHFLKGSSATLGLTKVKDSCEKIQHYGAKKDDTGTRDEPSDETCLSRIKETLALVREEYNEVEKVLKRFYETNAAANTPTKPTSE